VVNRGQVSHDCSVLGIGEILGHAHRTLRNKKIANDIDVPTQLIATDSGDLLVVRGDF
jgi:hypothetical protein